MNMHIFQIRALQKEVRRLNQEIQEYAEADDRYDLPNCTPKKQLQLLLQPTPDSKPEKGTVKWDQLVEQLEEYGNLEGTEAQLDKATALLRIAIWVLHDKDAFFKHPDVREIIKEMK
jgi:hypothetical protein